MRLEQIHAISLYLVTAVLKSHCQIVLMITAMLCYTRTHHANLLQKLFAIYLKFRGLSAKAFDTLHALAVTMSHRWAAEHVARMSQSAMQEVTGLMQIYPWLISYDNINIPFRVFSQRLDNKDSFSSGVAATVYIKRKATALAPGVSKLLHESRCSGMQNPINFLDIFQLSMQSAPRIATHTTYHVLRFLLDAPEFQLSTYPHRNSPLLQAPPPVHVLHHGHEHITLQYLLGSINVPEVSYADNERVVDELMNQLGLGSTCAECQGLADEKILAWIGDQLTVDRLRGLFKFRSQSARSSDLGGVVLLVAIIMRFPLAFGVFVGVECVLGIVSPALSGVCAREGPSTLFLLRVTMFSMQWSQQSPNGAAKYSKSSSPFL